MQILISNCVLVEGRKAAMKQEVINQLKFKLEQVEAGFEEATNLAKQFEEKLVMKNGQLVGLEKELKRVMLERDDCKM